MSIAVVCPSCGTTLGAPATSAGKIVICSRCKSSVPVPVTAVPLVAQAVAAPAPSQKYCHECGALIRRKAVICPKCGVRQGSQLDDEEDEDYPPQSTNRIAAGIFGILLGALGIHKFILGMPVPGIIVLLITVLTCGYGGIVTWVIGLVEGIIYLSTSEKDFYKKYVVNKRQWF
jgi:TM2 domain-containing membrane protein YozV/ribosomal protein L32